MVEEILAHNQAFVARGEQHHFRTDKYPNRRIAVLSCMDARLSELLPAAMGLGNGDAKFIKNAGGIVTHAFGSVMRSLMIAVYDLRVEEIIVVGHDDCGVESLDAQQMIAKMLARGIAPEVIETVSRCGIDLTEWLKDFDSVDASVLDTVDQIRNHPLMPADVVVTGLVIDPETGALHRAHFSDERTSKA